MSIMRTVSRTKNFQQGGNKTALLVGMPKSHKSVRKIPLPDFLLKLANKFKSQLKLKTAMFFPAPKYPWIRAPTKTI